MKKRLFAIVLSLVMTVPMLTACESDPMEYVTRGDEYVAVEDYESAITCYTKAGEAGIEKLKQVHLTVAKKRLWADDFDKAMEYLNTEAAGLVTLEEAGEMFLSHLIDQIEEEKAERMPIIEETEEKLIKAYYGEIDMDYADRQELRGTWEDNISWYRSKVLSLLEDASAAIPEGMPGLQEVQNEGYYLAGVLELRSEKLEHYRYVHWENILPYWANCTEGPGYEITQAINQINDRNYQDGFRVLKEQIEDPEILSSLYLEIMTTVKNESFADIMNFGNGYRYVFPNENAQRTMADAVYHSAKIRLDTDTVLTQAMIQELYDNCGKNPDGKVLILNEHDSSNKTISIYTHGMDQLPDSNYPADLESVEYVIYLETDTVETGGMFGSTTKELRRDAIITIYDAKTGNALWTQTQEGPTDFMMTYYGDTPPAVYCAGDPTVSLSDTFAEIAKYLK